MNLTINFFSLLPPINTKSSQDIVFLLPVLSKNNQIFLWTDQEEWDKSLEKYATVIYYDKNNLDWTKIHQGDINIYYIDNDLSLCESIVIISNQCPGLVILYQLYPHLLNQAWGVITPHFQDYEQLIKSFHGLVAYLPLDLDNLEVYIEGLMQIYQTGKDLSVRIAGQYWINRTANLLSQWCLSQRSLKLTKRVSEKITEFVIPS